MKKSLVALAVLAAAGAASAQSSVTLFGIVDAGVSYNQAKSNGAKVSQTTLSNSGYNSSRLGFRGTEDLGGGLAAGFWLEAPIANDSGEVGNARFWNRRSTVSLSGGFGEIRLGRDFTPTFWNDTTFDPFGTLGVGTNLITLTRSQSPILGTNGLAYDQYRSSNSIGYFLPPNLGGFYGQVMYGFHENLSTDVGYSSKGGQYVGGRFGYANGPLDVALAYGENRIAAIGLQDAKAKTLNLGASYDLGVVKLFGEVAQSENDFDNLFSAAKPSSTGYLLGLTAPVGAGLIRTSFGYVKGDQDTAGVPDPKAAKFAIGYVHNLSKRTALYATYAYTKSKNGASVGNTSSAPILASVGGSSVKATGMDFGLRHSF